MENLEKEFGWKAPSNETLGEVVNYSSTGRMDYLNRLSRVAQTIKQGGQNSVNWS